MSVRIIEASLARPRGHGGGAVTAPALLDTFPPVLVAAFGERWFEDGSLSLDFRATTQHGEPVRAGLVVDDTGVAAASIVTPDGVVVADGTATVGRAPTVRSVDGDAEPIPAAMVHCPSVAQSRRVFDGHITSPLEWYHGTSPWGPAVTAPSSTVEMFIAVAEAHLAERMPHAAGRLVSVELRYFGEPVVCDTEYAVDGTVGATGESLWFDMSARDERGDLVAGARLAAEVLMPAAPGRRDDRRPATVRAGG